jgi:nucleoside-diphosphate-sugar epimerase
LGAAVVAALTPEHEVRTLAADPRDGAADAALTEGAGALVHLDPIAGCEGSDREVLDRATRGTYVLMRAAIAAGVRRVVLGSSLSLLGRYPASWAVSETWRPLPDVADVRQLAVHLAEQSTRQFVFFEPVEVVCLRLGDVVEDRAVRSGRDARWLHVEDAVEAVRSALTAPLGLRIDDARASDTLPHGWRVFHIPGAGRTRVPLAEAGPALGYRPVHDLAPAEPPSPTEAERTGDTSLLAPARPIPSRPIRRVLVLGAGGPLAAATARALAPSYVLRLTDVRTLPEAAEGPRQSEGAPLPAVLPPPHEHRRVDVTDLGQVVDAADGMDAIINCTVVRPHCLGAYNVMRAAVAAQIRRVVHTGPLQVSSEWPAGYAWDFDVPDDAPGRSGGWLYGHTKLLGQEVVRLFAEAHDLEVPALYFSAFVDPATARPRLGGVHPMSISWDDSAEAMRRALEVPSLPSPFEIFHILADLPHGKYSSAKARRVLGWSPRDSLHHLWARRPESPTA